MSKSKNDWYEIISWYNTRSKYGVMTRYMEEENQRKLEEKPPKEAKYTPKLIIKIGCIILALIVLTSLIFSEGISFSDITSPTGRVYQNTWKEFYEKYYITDDPITPKKEIERAELPIDYTMELVPQGEEELSLREIYERNSDSIVAISAYADGEDGYRWGTGVILSEDGLVLTNTHIISECDSAKVTLFDDSVYEARLVGADSVSDVAVLKIDAEGLEPVVFGDSSTLAVGDSVAAIGNPLGEDFRCTMTDGIVSAIERGIRHKGNSMALIQTNTAINEGNSGGALFNKFGQVIGITNLKIMSSALGVEGMGFAIPSSTVESVVNTLVECGKVSGRPAIGITMMKIQNDVSEHYDLPEGLFVVSVNKNSDAKAQGIQVGDFITHANGTPVKSLSELEDIINSLQVGDTINLTISRDGESLDIAVKLMDRSDLYE